MKSGGKEVVKSEEDREIDEEIDDLRRSIESEVDGTLVARIISWILQRKLSTHTPNSLRVMAVAARAVGRVFESKQRPSVSVLRI